MPKAIRCLIVDDEPIAREILENHISRIEHVEVVQSCKSAMDAFEVINSEAIDLIFLDINMPGISGLSFAKSINNNIKIIFATAYRDYAVDGFDLQAVDYLLKPISFDRLLQAIKKYSNESESQEDSSESIPKDRIDYFFVRSERKMIKVNFDEITYIESFSDYLKIHLLEKMVITRETITSIEAKLPLQEFLRIHRSFIVSINHISSFTNEYVEIGKNQLPISRSYKKAVFEKLGKLK